MSPCHRVTLVIGYGNELRDDDGIGPHIAELMTAQPLPGVRAIGVRQLTPELAEPLAHAGVAIFVDAYAAAPATYGDAPRILIQAPTPASTGSAFLHTGDPCALLALAQALYGHAPTAWQIAVPGIIFDLGARFSALAEQGIAAALEQIAELAQQRCGAEIQNIKPD